MSQTKVEAPFVEGGGGINFKNLMINGDMQIAQRNTSVSSHSADTYVNIDRWKTRVNGQGVFTVSKSTTVPTGEGFVSSQKWDCTTADASPAAADFLIYEQRMEGQNLQHLAYGTSNAKKLTASFHVRSNKTGAYTVGLYSADGSRHIESSYTISSADTWEKKIVTFAGDTGGTINNDNGEGMKLWFWLGAGSNFSSGTHATSWASYSQANVLVDNQVNIADSTDNEWYITGIQLEVGDDASDFEHLPNDVQMNRCLRYCVALSSNAGDQRLNPDAAYLSNGWLYGASNMISVLHLPVPMRVEPSILSSDATDSFQFYRARQSDGAGAGDALDNLLLSASSSRVAVGVYNNSDVSGANSGVAGGLYIGDSTLVFGAEL